jgi:Fur family transcriptional regulator, ferric uptake regulator
VTTPTPTSSPTSSPTPNLQPGSGVASASSPLAGPVGGGMRPMPVMAPLCSVFRRFLKSKDLKYTPERADILNAIIEIDDVFEAEELLLKMRGQGHDVSKATIYRTIHLLLEAGIITQALFDAKQAHYQLIYGKAPRDFMVCMKTGRLIEFVSPELVALRDRICRELGWQPVGHRFQIYAISPEQTESRLEQSEPSP